MVCVIMLISVYLGTDLDLYIRYQTRHSLHVCNVSLVKYHKLSTMIGIDDALNFCRTTMALKTSGMSVLSKYCYV